LYFVLPWQSCLLNVSPLRYLNEFLSIQVLPIQLQYISLIFFSNGYVEGIIFSKKPVHLDPSLYLIYVNTLSDHELHLVWYKNGFIIICTRTFQLHFQFYQKNFPVSRFFIWIVVNSSSDSISKLAKLVIGLTTQTTNWSRMPLAKSLQLKESSGSS
jgi:hypothetical protein